MSKKEFTLYKIYYSTDHNEDVLVYIGRTKQPLNRRLHNHFFKTPMVRSLNLHQVSRIEFASFKTEADMNCMEIILINRYKPALNKDDKANDELTIEFPECDFLPFDCPHISRWKKEIEERQRLFVEHQNKKATLLEEHRNKRREIFSNAKMSSEEKTDTWTKWLVNYYEPRMQELKEEELGLF